MSSLHFADVWIQKSATGVLDLTLGTSQGTRVQWQGQWQEGFQIQALGLWLKAAMSSLIPAGMSARPLVHFYDEACHAVPPLVTRFANCERTFSHWLSARLTFDELEANLHVRIQLVTDPVTQSVQRLIPRRVFRQPSSLPALFGVT